MASFVTKFFAMYAAMQTLNMDYTRLPQIQQGRSVPKIIWSYWEGNLPLVETCVKSWKYWNPDWEIRLLNETTYQNYVTLGFIPSKVQFKSDLIRTKLLHTYGGVWMDATIVLLTRLEDFISPDSVTVFEFPLKKGIYESYFYSSPKGFQLFGKTAICMETSLKSKSNKFFKTASNFRQMMFRPNYFYIYHCFSDLLKNATIPSPKLLRSTDGPIKLWSSMLYLPNALDYATEKDFNRSNLMIKLDTVQRANMDIPLFVRNVEKWVLKI